MNPGTIRKCGWDPAADFRGKATFGVACTAVCLLLPVAIYDLLTGSIAIGIGSLGIVAILAANAYIVSQGYCHQNLTLFGLIPAGMVFMIGVYQTDGVIASLWCFPALVACYCMLSERKAWIGNLTILAIALPMTWLTLEFDYATRVTATLCAVSVFSAIMVRVIDEQRRMLQEQLVRDPLTGLLNRLTFNDRMAHAVELYRQQQLPVSLLAIDIDRFKHLNDTHGHAVGDRVLQETARVINDVLRHDDSTFRMGGEEFTVLLQGANENQACATAERIRHGIAHSHVENVGPVTVSIGVSEYDFGESWEAWAKRGDDRLYAAKRTGRNRVVADDLPGTPKIQLVKLS